METLTTLVGIRAYVYCPLDSRTLWEAQVPFWPGYRAPWDWAERRPQNPSAANNTARTWGEQPLWERHEVSGLGDTALRGFFLHVIYWVTRQVPPTQWAVHHDVWFLSWAAVHQPSFPTRLPFPSPLSLVSLCGRGFSEFLWADDGDPSNIHHPALVHSHSNRLERVLGLGPRIRGPSVLRSCTWPWRPCFTFLGSVS